MMTPTPLHPTSLLAIAVPKGAQNFQIDYGHLIYDLDEDPPKQYSEPLLNGKYKFIGLVTKDTIDFDAEGYVEDCPHYAKCWKKYDCTEAAPTGDFNPDFSCWDSEDSFRTLLSANECWFENPVLPDVLFPDEPITKAEADWHASRDPKWQAAQSKVSECWAIIEKV